MKVIDNQKYFSITDLEIILKNKCWKDDWGVETIYKDMLIQFLNEIELIEEEKKTELPEKIENSPLFGGITQEIVEKLNETLDYIKYKEEESKK